MTTSLWRALLCSIFLSGCSHSGSNLNVQATWGRNLSELGVTPLYPPTEDVQVGDIKLYVQNPCDTGVVSNQPQSVKLGSIPIADVQAALEVYYQQRQSLPSTSKPADTKPAPAKGAAAATAAKAEITTTGSATVTLAPSGGTSQAASASASSTPTVQAQPSADAQHPIFPGKSANPIMRLRMAAFPDFSFSDFTSAGVGAVIPAHALNVAAGVSGQKGNFGTVSVGQVEEEMLPATQMYSLVQNYLWGPHGKEAVRANAVNWWKTYLEDNMIRLSNCERYSRKSAYIFFVGDVYYARTFNYQFSQSEATAASLRIALATAAAEVPNGASQTASPSAVAATSANSAQIAADAAAIALKSLGSSSSPGGAASLEVGSQGGLALKQSYDRPMAFGVNQPMAWPAQCAIAYVNHASDAEREEACKSEFGENAGGPSR